MGIGDAAEIFERAQIVLGDAVTVGIHPPQLPLGDGMAAFGGVLQRVQRGRRRSRSRHGRSHLLQRLGIQGLRRGRTGLGGDEGKRGILVDRRTIKRESGTRHRRGP